MPKIYRPDDKQIRREKAKYGASISMTIAEVHAERLKDFQNHPEIPWTIERKACDIGYSVTVLITGNMKDRYSGKVYSQWADMKDGGFSLSVTECLNPYQARCAVLMILSEAKYRLDTIEETDVQF